MSIVLFVLAVAVLGIAVYVIVSVRSRRVTAGGMVRGRSGATSANGHVAGHPASPRETYERASAVVEPPVLASQAEPEAAAPAPEPQTPPEIRWYRDFDSRSTQLDERARLRLIGDLGVVAKDWCVPLLSGAFAQEVQAGHRQAALIALAACRSHAAEQTFRRALETGDASEAAIAADALADLEPPSPVAHRRTVERY